MKTNYIYEVFKLAKITHFLVMWSSCDDVIEPDAQKKDR